MTAALAWIRSNVASVAFVVVMVAALVAMPILASRLNAGVSERLNTRVNDLAKLEKLSKTTVDIPGVGSKTILVNQKLLDRYLDVVGTKRQDADRVYEAALAHNRKERGVLLEALFPEPPLAQREVLRKQLHDELLRAVQRLLAEIRAGEPPAPADVLAQLERERGMFLANTLQKDEGAALTEEEAEKLRDHMTGRRMVIYEDRANLIGVYVPIAALDLPVWNQQQQPTPTELFNWQWQYWMLEDLLHGIAAANEGSASVHVAPVKHVRSVIIEPYGSRGPSGGESAGGGEGRGGGAPGLGAGEGRRAAAPAAAAVAAAADPAKEIKPDFSATFTGRYSNPVYDVRHVQVSLVVETARLPRVLDRISAQNFVTIIDLVLSEVDPHVAIRDGFQYGQAHCSQVDLVLETVWLREWTSQFMPDEVKEALGVPVQTQPPPVEG
jgi:hypothetical protein